MSNKKSQVEDYLPLLGMIVILFMVMAYISYFNIKTGKDLRERVASEVIVKDSGQLLINYLSSPLDKYDANIAEGISIYHIDKNPDILSQLNIATENFFSRSSFETDYSTWSLEISHNDNLLIMESQRAKTQHILRKEIARTVIPVQGGSLIEVKLFIVTTKFVPT